ncbi:hypothetical protein DNTS_030132 [Danionella cerebrum]|uniref:Uncharacterized protein n=1 Tax=Danionella cerebrum TaxID=2873325 RepID=A0A553QMV9_9TELE|nr:hypothetical protein DNTS_030132 [Danionella translucida]
MECASLHVPVCPWRADWSVTDLCQRIRLLYAAWLEILTQIEGHALCSTDRLLGCFLCEKRVWQPLRNGLIEVFSSGPDIQECVCPSACMPGLAALVPPAFCVSFESVTPAPARGFW